MPLPERTYKHVNTSRNPTITNMEQFLRGTGGESSRISPTYSPSSSSPSSPYFERLKQHDPEEDHGLYQRKSVLTRVKEKAKKLRNSFSKRKEEEGNLTPSWGVSLEDDEEEEDAEYLGAPIYESELAPEEYKENARQHPRADPVISEKRVLRSPVKSGVEQNQDKSLSPVNSTTTTQHATTTTPSANNTMTETIAEKLTPASLEGSTSNAAYSTFSQTNDVSRTPPPNMSSQTSSVPSPIQNSSSPSPSLSGKNTIPKDAKDHLMSKSDPGNNEKTQSQVIPEKLSSRRSHSNIGVMEKVKGAVNSFLWDEEPSQQYAVKTPATNTSSQITNGQGVGQEENHGRILQAN